VSTSASKPRLRDAIAFADGHADEHERPPVFYNVEIKSRPEWDEAFHPPPKRFAERVLTVVEEKEVGPRTTIQSFDPRALEAVRAQNESVRMALLVSQTGNDGLDANLEGLSVVPDICSPDHRLVNATLVKAVHERGMALIPWTVNEPERMRRLVDLGVDGLVTDYPNRGRAALQEKTP